MKRSSFTVAMGTNLQNKTSPQLNSVENNSLAAIDYLVISYPQAVEEVHRSFLEAGVDVIETCSFRANRITMKEYGLQDRILDLNHAAASLARTLADEYSREGHPRFVAGSMGPSGKLPSMNDPELSNVTFDDLKAVFSEQARGLIEGGVDLLLI